VIALSVVFDRHLVFLGFDLLGICLIGFIIFVGFLGLGRQDDRLYSHFPTQRLQQRRTFAVSLFLQIVSVSIDVLICNSFPFKSESSLPFHQTPPAMMGVQLMPKQADRFLGNLRAF